MIKPAWMRGIRIFRIFIGLAGGLTEGQRAYIHHFNDRAADLQLARPMVIWAGRGMVGTNGRRGWAVRSVDNSEVAVAEACAQGWMLSWGI